MTFQRENRYIVIKRKDLHLGDEEALRKLMSDYHIPTRECLVIEREWPEYEPAWRMIQARVEGATLSPAHIEDGVDTSAWPACNPACDPEFNGHKSRHCTCAAAKAALSTLPAAVPAELTNVRCMCGDEYPHDSYAAGFIAGSGMCENCDAAIPAKEPPAAGVPQGWQPMETAPTDGTLLRLLVEFEDHPIEDGAGPFATVGTNYRDNTGEDAWQIVGWCWEQDRFIDGVGTPVGWLPMLAAAPTPPASEEAEELERLRDALDRIARIPGDSVDYHPSHMSRIARAAVGLCSTTPPASEQQQAVVLPERKQFPDPAGFATMPEWYARQHIEASTHNACLDELLRLNPHLAGVNQGITTEAGNGGEV